MIIFLLCLMQQQPVSMLSISEGFLVNVLEWNGSARQVISCCGWALQTCPLDCSLHFSVDMQLHRSLQLCKEMPLQAKISKTCLLMVSFKYHSTLHDRRWMKCSMFKRANLQTMKCQGWRDTFNNDRKETSQGGKHNGPWSPNLWARQINFSTVKTTNSLDKRIWEAEPLPVRALENVRDGGL